MSMIRKLTPDELRDGLKELLEWDALEMQIMPAGSGDSEILIPYLMNDAAECFYRLTGVVVPGSFPGKIRCESAGSVQISLQYDHDRIGILIREERRTTSIWYAEAFRELHCYQYHRIGHNWRKSREGECIRRLVNLLCVVADKNSYLESEACNRQEQELWPLIEFAPLCAWSPISDSITDWYPETIKGIETMIALVSETGDPEYLKLLEEYRERAQSGKTARKQRIGKQLEEMLLRPEHACIRHEIERRLISASLGWKERNYPDAQKQKMHTLRKQKEQEYLEKGYTGSYPVMERNPDAWADIHSDARRECTEGRTEKILFVEEHPFTVLESEEYQFRIYEIRECN